MSNQTTTTGTDDIVLCSYCTGIEDLFCCTFQCFVKQLMYVALSVYPLVLTWSFSVLFLQGFASWSSVAKCQCSALPGKVDLKQY